MSRFKIITIDDTEVGNCIVTAFKYMVQDVDSGANWFGSNNYTDCEEYIKKYT